MRVHRRWFGRRATPAPVPAEQPDSTQWMGSGWGWGDDEQLSREEQQATRKPFGRASNYLVVDQFGRGSGPTGL